MKTDLIWTYTTQGYSNKYTELQIYKEYLITEIDNLRKELNDETIKAEKGKVSSHVINIFTHVLEDRIKHLDVILKTVIFEINEMGKNEKKKDNKPQDPNK